MLHKSLLFILFFIFALPACSASTKETVAPITATIEATIEPTLTLSPSPIPSTVTPTMIPAKEYTSCADQKLIQETKDAFLKEVGMSAGEYIQSLIAVGKYDKQDGFSADRTSYYNIVYSGSAEASLEGVGKFSADDEAFCIYLFDDSDPNTFIPVVVAFTHNGEFFNTLGFGDRVADDGGIKPPNSMEEVRQWWRENPEKPSLGDIFEFAFWKFEGAIDSGEVASLSISDVLYASGVSEFLKLLDNDYLSRVPGTGSVVESAANLDPTLGDVGLVSSKIRRVAIRSPAK